MLLLCVKGEMHLIKKLEKKAKFVLAKCVAKKNIYKTPGPPCNARIKSNIDR